MLPERGTDQADGLRRMFPAARPWVTDIVAGGPGVGRASVAVNLAAALACAGRDTLLIDRTERNAASKVLRYLGMACGPGQSAAAAPGPVRAAPGLAVLSVERGVANAANWRASAALVRHAAARDCVLVSSAAAEPLIVAENACRDVLVVLSKDAAAITDAYALIKRMCSAGMRLRLRVVVNRVDSDGAALRIFRNLARVAHGYLDVRLELLGFVPAAAAIERAAAEGRPVLFASPRLPAARSFQRLAAAMTRDAAAGADARAAGPARLDPGAALAAL
ncbi:MAG: hypothetical protein IT531_23280 [Burkholderiales bacterium]|nr:hypothetical protein [Burkholderiales bacterium]